MGLQRETRLNGSKRLVGTNEAPTLAILRHIYGCIRKGMELQFIFVCLGFSWYSRLGYGAHMWKLQVRVP